MGFTLSDLNPFNWDYSGMFGGDSLTAGDILGAGIKGGLSYWGASEAADAAREAAGVNAAAIRDNATAALAAAQPWSVGGLGGTAQFDPDSQSALLNLSPELAEIYSGALGRSGLWGAQAEELGLNPFAAADKFYQMNQALVAPEEEKLRTDMETRLLAQGRLGSTGGRYDANKLEDTILQDRARRRVSSFNQAQTLIDKLLGRESGDLGTATGMLGIPLELANLGMGVGGHLSGIAGTQMGARNVAASLTGQADALSPSGTALTTLAGLFMRPQPAKPT